MQRCLPLLSLKPYVLSTPIFYPNASPHIGHLHTLVLADVIARFQRLRFPKRDVVFSTGTDEHGLKIQQAARKAGRGEPQFCAEIAQRFKDLAGSHQISNSVFLRTSEEAHKKVATHLWEILVRNGHIYTSTHEGWYSVSDECFYPTTKVDNGRSVETGSAVEWTSEVNFKFKLSAFREKLLEWLEANENAVLPRSKQVEIMNELKADEVLQDLSVSRPVSRLHWGVPVPAEDGVDPGQTMYVWLEALANYLTVTGWPAKRNSWPADVHVVGKDILRFHAIYWPAFLMAAGLPLPKQIVSHAHWLSKEMKMSKSIGNVMDPYVAGERVGVDGLRYFLLRAGGALASDSNFDSENVGRYYRVELKNQIGNLAAGITSEIIHARTSMYAEEQHAALKARVLSKEFEELNLLVEKLLNLPHNLVPALEQKEFGRVLDQILSVVSEANSIHSQVRPWASSTPEDLAQASLFCTRECLRIIAILLQPVMPHKMHELLTLLEIPENRRLWDDALELVDSRSYTPQTVKLFK